MIEKLRSCPDCNGELVSIKVLDSTTASFNEGAGDVELSYTTADDKKGVFSGAYKKKGKVRSMMCGKCGRIYLYGKLSGK